MKLIVGLGNPGETYALNRHNIGFMAVDDIARGHNFGTWKKKFQGQLADGQVGTYKCILLKPATYMNESGRAVGEAMRYLKIKPADVIVIHDELDLPSGKVRVKTGGGNAGHNGLKSITAHIGNDYVRVRLGIGHPGDRALVANYVLSDFSKTDREWVSKLTSDIARGMLRLLEGGDAFFLSEVSRARPTGISYHHDETLLVGSVIKQVGSTVTQIIDSLTPHSNVNETDYATDHVPTNDAPASEHHYGTHKPVSTIMTSQAEAKEPVSIHAAQNTFASTKQPNEQINTHYDIATEDTVSSEEKSVEEIVTIHNAAIENTFEPIEQTAKPVSVPYNVLAENTLPPERQAAEPVSIHHAVIEDMLSAEEDAVEPMNTYSIATTENAIASHEPAVEPIDGHHDFDAENVSASQEQTVEPASAHYNHKAENMIASAEHLVDFINIDHDAARGIVITQAEQDLEPVRMADDVENEITHHSNVIENVHNHTAFIAHSNIQEEFKDGVDYAIENVKTHQDVHLSHDGIAFEDKEDLSSSTSYDHTIETLETHHDGEFEEQQNLVRSDQRVRQVSNLDRHFADQEVTPSHVSERADAVTAHAKFQSVESHAHDLGQDVGHNDEALQTSEADNDIEDRLVNAPQDPLFDVRSNQPVLIDYNKTSTFDHEPGKIEQVGHPEQEQTASEEIDTSRQKTLTGKLKSWVHSRFRGSPL